VSNLQGSTGDTGGTGATGAIGVTGASGIMQSMLCIFDSFSDLQCMVSHKMNAVLMVSCWFTLDSMKVYIM